MDKALNRGYVLLPLAAPHRPPGRAGLHQALDRASSLGPLPAAVEATPRMTHETSDEPAAGVSVRLADGYGVDAAILIPNGW